MHEGAVIMTTFANRKHIRGTAPAASLAVCLVLGIVAGGKAFADSANQAPAAVPTQPAPAQLAPGTPGTAPPAAGRPDAGGQHQPHPPPGEVARGPPGPAPPAAGAPTAGAPTMPQQSTPAFRPGFLHQLRTW